MHVKVIKNDPKLILEEIKKETPIIVFRKFLNPNDCKKIINICHKNNAYKDHRKLKVNKYLPIKYNDETWFIQTDPKYYAVNSTTQTSTNATNDEWYATDESNDARYDATWNDAPIIRK